MYVYIYGSFTICCRILRVMTAYLCSRGTWGRSPRTRDMFGAAASRSRRDWDLCFGFTRRTSKHFVYMHMYVDICLCGIVLFAHDP